MKELELLASLGSRGMSLGDLARLAQTTETYARRVLARGRGKRGGAVRRRLARYMTGKELKIVGWNEFGDIRY